MKLTKLECFNIIRKREGFTLKKLSLATGLTVGFLGCVASGNSPRISERSKKKIARAMGVPIKLVF